MPKVNSVSENAVIFKFKKAVKFEDLNAKADLALKQIREERIKEQRLSGLTQKKWCDENGFTLSGLRYWIQRTKKEDLGKKVNDSENSKIS